MIRTTIKLKQEQNEPKNNRNLPTLKEILVNTSVYNGEPEEITRTLRLVGESVIFYEVQPKKWNDEEKKWKEHEFPDAELTKAPTRIGADDIASCPWAKMGFQRVKKYAQRCFEQQEDKTWVHKILVKGTTVFQPLIVWEEGRREERGDDPSISCFLGGDKAPLVRVKAKHNPDVVGKTEYIVTVGSAEHQLTEEMINMMKAIYCPSADELAVLREEHNQLMEENSEMPEWRDYFAYGHNLAKIYKFTPVKTESNQVLKTENERPVANKPAQVSADDDFEIDETVSQVDDVDSGDDELDNW